MSWSRKDIKIPNPSQERSGLSEVKRPCLTPSNLRSLPKEYNNLLNQKRKVSTAANKSEIHSRLMSRVGSPESKRTEFNCIVRTDKQRRKTLESKYIDPDDQAKNDILLTVENKIRDKFMDSSDGNSMRIKRFKQLQEYLKMANREVTINKNVRNESNRIVKGEIPLGTNTHIKHEIRENYPSIMDIKRRLKNCLAIECNFDEVIKYANEFYGIKSKNEMIKQAYEEQRRKVIKSHILVLRVLAIIQNYVL